MIVSNKDTFLQDTSLFESAMAKLTEHLHTNYYDLYREWHYKDIEPRIFAEELLGEEVQNGEWEIPENYRMFYFGKKIFIQVDDANYEHTHKRWFYDEEWIFQHFSYNMPILSDSISKPAMLEDMKIIANLLARDIGFVRVDLYTTKNKIIVGELTLTPIGGTGKFTPKEWDKTFGDLWGRAQRLS